MIQIGWSLEPLIAFLMVLARMAGLVVFTPILGSSATPPQVRASLAVALSLLLYPGLGAQVAPVAPGVLSLFLAIGTELMIGLLLGLVGHLFLAAIQYSGQLMGFQMGFSIINLIDPQTQVEAPVLAILQNMVGMLLFLFLNAHHWFIEAIATSYQILPERSLSISGPLAQQILYLGGQIFTVGFQLAAPFILVLVVADIFIGIVGRAAPQIHILIIGMPLKVLAGFLLLSYAAPVVVRYAGNHISGMQGHLYRLLQLLGS